jgi:hypothetical protein
MEMPFGTDRLLLEGVLIAFEDENVCRGGHVKCMVYIGHVN